MGDLKIGTSGWSYKDWETVFYPPGETNKLQFYAKYFSTVEIDSTFYAYPRKAMVQAWARNSPQDFVFSAKLPKLITHDKKLDPGKGTKLDLYRFLDLMKPLLNKHKLGPILIQLPPSFSFDDLGKLKAFLNIIPNNVSFAAEFRHKSWLRKETWDLLSKHNVANAIVDEPLMPPDTLVTADFSFVRWHGHGESPWYNYRYKESQVESWKEKLEDLSKRTKVSFGYFNNHFRGFAIENALQLMEKMGNATPEQKSMSKLVTKRIDHGIEERRSQKDQPRLEAY